MRDVVLAVDPGETTGWVTYMVPDTVIGWGEYEMMPFLDATELFLQGCGERCTIVVESYIITTETGKKTQQHWSLEIIGALRYLAHKYGAAFDVSQSASAAKSFSKNVKLKALGWYRRGEGHATDAHRHLLLWLVSHGYELPRALIQLIHTTTDDDKGHDQ